MKHYKNFNLKENNTFNLNCIAENYYEIDDINELSGLDFFDDEYLILSGGSNILFKSLSINNVLKLTNEKIILEYEDDASVTLRVGAGRNWNEFVKYCVDNSYYGLENLALIPGNVGAAPIQNIGAYGCEQESCFLELIAYDIQNQRVVRIDKSACEFSYRNSIFKQENGKYLLFEVVYKLSKIPKYNLNYKELSDFINSNYGNNFSIRDIYFSVCKIRNSKLPDPKILGNSGSFFKNPIITIQKYEELLKFLPRLKSFYYDEKSVKISAAYIIEHCGFKGVKYDNTDAGVYEKHALILVNHGSASGEDIYNLSELIIKTIKDKFNINLEREVNII